MSGSSDILHILLEQVDRLLSQYATKEVLGEAEHGAWPTTLWSTVAEAGVLLAMVPEEQGGAGLPPADAMLLLRRVGYHCTPAPVPETMFAAYLWALAGGKPSVEPLSLAPTNFEEQIKLQHTARGAFLAGQARRVPWGRDVSKLIVFARDEQNRPYLVRLSQPFGEGPFHRNLAFEPRPTISFDGITVAETEILPAPSICINGVLELGALLRSQQMVGAMERCLDYALTYANERKQFGRPIAKFQAVQHMLAVAAGQYAAATAAADVAAQAIGSPQFGFAVAVAKARVGEAAGVVAEVAHQVHGAMGFTQEHPLHFATRRLWSWRDEFGHEAYWQERIGRIACETGGANLWPMLVDAQG
jgi:acyl-CoA dehydrogenase